MTAQTAPGPVERLRNLLASECDAADIGFNPWLIADALVDPATVEELAREICCPAMPCMNGPAGCARERFVRSATTILTFLSAKALGEADGG